MGYIRGRGFFAAVSFLSDEVVWAMVVSLQHSIINNAAPAWQPHGWCLATSEAPWRWETGESGCSGRSSAGARLLFLIFLIRSSDPFLIRSSDPWLGRALVYRADAPPAH